MAKESVGTEVHMGCGGMCGGAEVHVPHEGAEQMGKVWYIHGAEVHMGD